MGDVTAVRAEFLAKVQALMPEFTVTLSAERIPSHMCLLRAVRDVVAVHIPVHGDMIDDLYESDHAWLTLVPSVAQQLRTEYDWFVSEHAEERAQRLGCMVNATGVPPVHRS